MQAIEATLATMTRIELEAKRQELTAKLTDQKFDENDAKFLSAIVTRIQG